MPKVMCCNHLQHCKLYYLKPNGQFRLSMLYWLDECSICGHCVLYISRFDYDNNHSSFRKSNLKARALFAKLKNQIDFEYRQQVLLSGKSRFYLHYNDRGTIKKCYSNFRTLQMGRHDGVGEALPDDKRFILH